MLAEHTHFLNFIVTEYYICSVLIHSQSCAPC